MAVVLIAEADDDIAVILAICSRLAMAATA